MLVYMSLSLDGVCRGAGDADARARAPAPRMKIAATFTILPKLLIQ